MTTKLAVVSAGLSQPSSPRLLADQLSAAAVGGGTEDGMPGAVAVECLHNFAFLHDDVQDGDRFRRQRETAWVVFGAGRALNAGTTMLVLGHQQLLDAPSEHREAALRLLVRTCATMLTGQGLDLAPGARVDRPSAHQQSRPPGRCEQRQGCRHRHRIRGEASGRKGDRPGGPGTGHETVLKIDSDEHRHGPPGR